MLPTLDAQGILDRIKKAADSVPKPAPRPQAGTPVSTDDLLAGAQTTPARPVTIDPKVMPDILGIHLGMPAAQAEATLKAQYAKGAFRPYAQPLPPLKDPITYGWTMNQDAVGAAGNDQAAVGVTAPPNIPVVWRVGRLTNMMHINRATLIASLREKYGKESIAFADAVEQASISTDDRRITWMVWLYDESGKRVAPPREARSLQQCTGFVGPRPIFDQELLQTGDAGRAQYTDPWLTSSCVAAVVNFTPWQGRDPQIIEVMMSGVIDMPLYLRSAKNTAGWYQAGVEQLRQQELERSKQARPKL
jgi:hypothetical protein